MPKFARIAYNSENWRAPTGEAARLETNTFCSANGFGYEEWLFRAEWAIDGWRYAFLQGVNDSYETLIKDNSPFDVVVYARRPDKAIQFIASISDVECISSTQAKDAVETFKRNGWFEQMKAEVNEVGGDTSHLDNPTFTTDILNIRYRPNSLQFFPAATFAAANDPIQRWTRYQLISGVPTKKPLTLPGAVTKDKSSPSFYWVNLGLSHKEVKEHSFLWAPAFGYKEDGSKVTNAGWDCLQKVRRGDVIFCHRKGEIIDVAVATSDAMASARPANRTFDAWKADGFRVDVKLEELETPIDVALFKETLIAVHNQACKPALFDRNGGTAQMYMVSLPLGAGALIMSHLGDIELQISDQSQRQKPSGGGPKKKGGTREVIAQARVGQGQFRADLISLWEGKCAITGLARNELLVASHIVPWSLSNDSEKVDPHNGLLLSPAIDKLFDRGYVTFGDDGSIVIKSTLISHAELQLLGLSPNARIPTPNADQRSYLKRHRQIYHFESDDEP